MDQDCLRPMKYTKAQLLKIEDILKTQGYKLRYEKGNFNSGFCVVEQNKVIVINKFFDSQARGQVLWEIIQTLDLDESKLDEKSMIVLKTFLKESP